MLALKIRRHLERAWWPLEVTVEEGLRQLETLCVMEPVHRESAEVVARQVPEPSARQNHLLEALKLGLPATVPPAEVIVGTRKKINKVRKTLEKKAQTSVYASILNGTSAKNPARCPHHVSEEGHSPNGLVSM